jgi:hypothetical protein
VGVSKMRFISGTRDSDGIANVVALLTLGREYNVRSALNECRAAYAMSPCLSLSCQQWRDDRTRFSQ